MSVGANSPMACARPRRRATDRAIADEVEHYRAGGGRLVAHGANLPMHGAQCS
jgi:hypothetical protein